jgi:hypothetical protein
MNKLVAVLFLLMCSISFGAITRVQSCYFSTSTANATNMTFVLPAAPDLTDNKYHYLLVAMGSTVTNQQGQDSGGAVGSDYTWLSLANTGTNSAGVAVYWARIYSGASATFKLSAAASVAQTGIAVEYKSDAPLRLDRQQVNSGSSTSASTGTTSTISNASELVFAALVHRLTATVSSQTSGTLTIGKPYKIVTFVAGDNFTNVGASSNASGICFVATGTTPTTWSNGSTVHNLVGTYASPTSGGTATGGSIAEIIAGGATTDLATTNNDREVEALERIYTGTGTVSASATVTGSNNWSGVVCTFQESASQKSSSFGQ